MEHRSLTLEQRFELGPESGIEAGIIVRRGVDRETGRACRVREARTLEAAERLRREATLMAHVEHGGLPKWIGLFDEGGRTALACEAAEGKTLAELAAGGTLAGSELVAILRDAARVLERLHSFFPSLAHGRLSAERIVVGPGGRVVLLDASGEGDPADDVFAMARLAREACGSLPSELAELLRPNRAPARADALIERLSRLAFKPPAPVREPQGPKLLTGRNLGLAAVVLAGSFWLGLKVRFEWLPQWRAFRYTSSGTRRVPGAARARRAKRSPVIVSKEPGYPLPPEESDYREIERGRAQSAPDPAAAAVRVSIRADGLKPAGFTLGSGGQDHPMTSLRPEAVVREPAYQGTSRRYGSIRLGTRHATPFWFALDLIGGPHPVLYFDRNHDGDLTNDSGPLANQGTGIFATTLTVPWSELVDDPPFEGDFNLWLYGNDTAWPRGYLTHYSRTELAGVVRLGGRTYDVRLSDLLASDGDLTKDGVRVDLNRDGKFDYKAPERVMPGETLELDGARYRFEVAW